MIVLSIVFGVMQYRGISTGKKNEWQLLRDIEYIPSRKVIFS